MLGVFEEVARRVVWLGDDDERKGVTAFLGRDGRDVRPEASRSATNDADTRSTSECGWAMYRQGILIEMNYGYGSRVADSTSKV